MKKDIWKKKKERKEGENEKKGKEKMIMQSGTKESFPVEQRTNLYKKKKIRSEKN